MDPPLPPRLARNVDVGPQVLFRVGADPQFAEVFPPQRGRAHDGTADRRDKVTEVLITEARRLTVPTFPARTIEELPRQLEPSQELPVAPVAHALRQPPAVPGTHPIRGEFELRLFFLPPFPSDKLRAHPSIEAAQHLD